MDLKRILPQTGKSLDAYSQFQDKLIVRGLNCRSVVGGDHWDRPKLQPIVIDLAFYTNIETCGDTDILAHSLSYSDLASEAMEIAENSEFESFHELAVRISEILLQKFGGVKVMVEVQKPKGLLHAETSGVVILRTKDDLTKENLDKKVKFYPEDLVFVRALRLNTIIGVHAWEREAKQVVLIYLELYPGFQISTKGGEPGNYRNLVLKLSAMVEESKYKTVEALATSIAKVTILDCKYPKVTVRVEKPSALRFAAAAAAEITRDRDFFLKGDDVKELELGEKVEAVIAFGSNLEDRYKNVVDGIRSLEGIGCEIVDTSFLYESSPMYVTDQPRFLNGVVKIKTSLSPGDLLVELKNIESELGRVKTIRNGPRLIDLDIVYYSNRIVDDSNLIIPHLGLAEREFVLRPLSDVSPNWVHPKLHLTSTQLLDGLMKVQKITDLSRVLPTKDMWVWGKKTYIMGILNVTPDSFSDGGKFNDLERAVDQAKKLIEGGADILDIGGMSTRPNAEEISVEEELARVVPIIQKLRSDGITCVISVDTFHSEVAQKAVEAGANLINDVSGGNRDPNMLKVMAKTNVPVCLMHMRGDSQTMTSLNQYGLNEGDVVKGVQNELEESTSRAIAHGVFRWNIILDPGLGFAKNTAQNLELLRTLPRLTQPSSFPVLIGASRKKFIGEITGKEQPSDRIFGTAATVTASIQAGAHIVRIHDVNQLRDVVLMSDALYRN